MKAQRRATSRKTLWAAALALVSSVACGGSSIFDVKVTIDNSVTFESISMVTLCQVIVSGADSDDFFLAKDKTCKDMLTTRDLGTFGYTSSATSGTVNFQVNLIGNNPTDPPIATGSGSGAAREGSRTAVNIVVR